jgi:hypothetical protein
MPVTTVRGGSDDMHDMCDMPVCMWMQLWGALVVPSQL